MSWISKNFKKRTQLENDVRSLLSQREEDITSLRAQLAQANSFAMHSATENVERIAALQERLSSVCLELASAKTSIQELRSELFDVPSLPGLNYLEKPIQDRLDKARIETEEFLRTGSDPESENYQYLLMQMLFRGPVEQVKKELSVLIEGLAVPVACRTLPVVDVGCGRGELLDTLGENGFRSIGIDTSQLMIEKLRERNLEALQGDAIERLAEFPDESLCGVTAFHVIEHLQHDYFQELLRIAFQKIAPNGFVFLETPNPFCFESLSFFYTDSTHVRPIQPFQLAFHVESVGFVQSRAHFSAPVPATRVQATQNWIRLYQNHGIVAYKPKGTAQSGTVQPMIYGNVA